MPKYIFPKKVKVICYDKTSFKKKAVKVRTPRLEKVGQSCSRDIEESQNLDEISVEPVEIKSSTSSETSLTFPIELQPTVIISDIKLYELELNKACGFHDVYGDKSCFVLPGFNKEKKDLNFSRMFVVQRREIQLQLDESSGVNGCQYVYNCSCEPLKAEFVASLPKILTQPYTPVSECLHIQLIQLSLPELWEEFVSNESMESCEAVERKKSSICNLSFDLSKLVVSFEENVGVIGMDFNGLKCYLCSEDNCIHVKYLQKLDPSEASTPPCVTEFFEIASASSSNYRKLICLSKSKIMFNANDIYKECLRKKPSEYLELKNNNWYLAQTRCFKCSCLADNESTSVLEKSIKLYTKIEVFPCVVHTLECSCGTRLEYDGVDEGILYMGSFGIHHSVLRDYLHHFLLGNGTTLIGYYKVWKANLSDAGCGEIINYDNWRLSWYSFLKLLDIDYASGFTCPLCGPQPDIIVCDATSLGFQRKFANTVFKKQPDTSEIIPRVSRHEERIAIPKKSTRTLLFAWCKSSITKSQLFNLKKELSSSPEIYEAFLWTEENFHVLPKGVKGFFCCLAKASPVCSYIPYSEECYDLINHLFNEKARGNPSTLESLQRKMPIIYKLVTEFSSKLPLEYKGMLFKLISLSQSPFIKNIPITKSSYEDPMSYFPALPVVRSRGRYSIDTAKEESLCSKAYPSHKKLTAGIFTLYCIHGINYGFQCMESAESVNVPFTIFRTRFNTAPKTIIYDNCCNLHTYCLNRDPCFFKNTQFLVDRFHWYNHTGCAESYYISNYPSMSHVNSQINEQQNATTKKLKTQLSYMSPENFKDHCVLYLWYRNKIKIGKL